MQELLHPEPRNRVEASTGIVNPHSKDGMPTQAAQDPELMKLATAQPISVKGASTYKSSLYTDNTVGRRHTVGQIDQNVHKVMRVLDKSNFLKLHRLP